MSMAPLQAAPVAPAAWPMAASQPVALPPQPEATPLGHTAGSSMAVDAAPLPSDACVTPAFEGFATGPNAPAPVVEQPAAAGLQWAVRHSELRVILDAIRNTSSREAAARMLGISPRTLRYKLAQMRDLGMMTAEAAN